MIKRVFIIALIISVVAACSRKYYPPVIEKHFIHDTVFVTIPPIPIVPPETTNPIDSLLYEVHTAGTPNFNLRKPNYVIIHHTAQKNCDQTFYTFSLLRTKVSSHYVICKDGSVHHLLNDWLRAWHAGNSKWGSITDINSCSVGIELDNNGKEPFAEPQINALLVLLDTLKKNYNIPTPNFIGHADIAPRRKDDPSIFFPWKLLADRGFGLWQDSIITEKKVDTNFNPMMALRLIGYDIKDSTAAIIAFKRHFMQQDGSKILNEADKRTLNNLYRKYMY